MRSPLRGLVLASLLIPKVGAAQHCHTEVPREIQARTALSLSAESAGYSQTNYLGHYEGAFVGARHDFGFLLIGAKAPLYALTRNGESVRGFGDLSVDTTLPLRFDSSMPRNFGLAVVTTLPTGDAGKGLGMGHVMFMPQAWFRFVEGSFEVYSSVGAGLAWTNASGGHHHHGPRPIVNPMNGEELTFHLQPSLALSSRFRAQTRISGALPITESGAPRLLLGAGFEAAGDTIFSSVEVSTSLIGDTYLAKLSLGLGARF